MHPFQFSYFFVLFAGSFWRIEEIGHRVGVVCAVAAAKLIVIGDGVVKLTKVVGLFRVLFILQLLVVVGFAETRHILTLLEWIRFLRLLVSDDELAFYPFVFLIETNDFFL